MTDKSCLFQHKQPNLKERPNSNASIGSAIKHISIVEWANW